MQSELNEIGKYINQYLSESDEYIETLDEIMGCMDRGITRYNWENDTDYTIHINDGCHYEWKDFERCYVTLAANHLEDFTGVIVYDLPNNSVVVRCLETGVMEG